VYCYILDIICLSFTDPDSPIHRLIREAFGCHWQLVQTVYADSYPIVEAECSLDLYHIGANCKTPQYLRAGLGRRFYGHRLRDEPAGRRRTNRFAGWVITAQTRIVRAVIRTRMPMMIRVCGDVLRTLVKRGWTRMGCSMFFQASVWMSIPRRATSVRYVKKPLIPPNSFIIIVVLLLMFAGMSSMLSVLASGSIVRRLIEIAVQNVGGRLWSGRGRLGRCIVDVRCRRCTKVRVYP
jgi:hypothetical protein